MGANQAAAKVRKGIALFDLQDFLYQGAKVMVACRASRMASALDKLGTFVTGIAVH